MAVKVRIPSPLQKMTGNQAEVQAKGSTVAEIIESLEKDFPGIKGRLCDDSGQVRRFVNIYINNEDIRFLEKEKTRVKEGDEVSIIPAIAGG